MMDLTKKDVEVVDSSTGEIQEQTPQVPMSAPVNDMLALIKIAENLFASGLFPNTRNPAGAYAIVEYGREIGVAPMTALQNISIIKGKPACNSSLMLSKALQAGIRIEVLLENEHGCKILMQREGYSDYTSEFTMNEAKQAQLVKPGSGYAKYPKDMLFARAVTRGLRRIAPDVIHGLYSVEEMSAGQYLNADEIPVVTKDVSHEVVEDTEELKALKDEFEELVKAKEVPEDKRAGFKYFTETSLLHNIAGYTRWIADFKTFEDKEKQND